VTFGKWIAIALLLGAGVHLWQVHARSVQDRHLQATGDSYGFVPVITSAGAPADTVVILAALNCPSAAAKRAKAMAERLSEMGIPNSRADSYQASITDRKLVPLLQQTNQVLGGEIPVVIINGMGKANPTVDEVAAEYRRRK
jgi:hypothetical protein